MKKTLIASTLVTLILAPAVNAVEIYHDSKNKVTIGGYMGIRLLTTDGDTEMVNGSSRINFNFSHKLSHGWQANSTFEWGVNPFNTSLVFNPDSQFESQSSDLLSSRLAFIGLSHDQYGSISFGRQWSAYYNVVGGTDMAYVWGGETSGAYSLDGSGGVNGTGRADKAIQYSNSVGDLSYTVQAQIQQDDISFNEANFPNLGRLEYNNTYGASAIYALTDKLSVGIGGNFGEFEAFLNDGSKISEDDLIYAISATWGTMDMPGLYLSANINRNEFHDLDAGGHLIPKSVAGEAFASYNFGNGVTPYFSYNGRSTDDYVINTGEAAKYNQQIFVLGALYTWDDVILMYIEGRTDTGDYTLGNTKIDGDNAAAVGLRYTF